MTAAFQPDGRVFWGIGGDSPSSLVTLPMIKQSQDDLTIKRVGEHCMEKQKVKIGPVSKDLLYLKVADAVYAYIKANDLKEGDKLPSEREMASMFQTDRGVIEVKTGRGAFLTGQCDCEDSIMFRPIPFDFREMHEMKSVLEQLLIRKALGAEDAQKRELLEIAESMSRMAAEGVYSDATDHTFHEKLLKMGGNHMTEQIVMQLRMKSLDLYWAAKGSDNSPWLHCVPVHLDLARALIDCDEKRALAAMDEINRYSMEVQAQALGKLTKSQPLL